MKSLIHQQTQKVKYISAQSMLQLNFDFRLKFFNLQCRLIINFFCQHGHDLILAITGCEAAIRFLKPDWQIDNGFFNRAKIAPTQILVYSIHANSVRLSRSLPGTTPIPYKIIFVAFLYLSLIFSPILAQNLKFSYS